MELLENLEQVDLKQLTYTSKSPTYYSTEKDAKLITTEQNVTLSKYSIQDISKEDLSNLVSKILFSSKFQSPLFLQFIGFNIKKKDNLSIITEKSKNGSLHHIIELEKEGKIIPGWDNTKKLINIYGIASGLSILHSHNITHNTLKASHIYLDEHLFPKIKLISEISNIHDIEMSAARVYQERENFLYVPPEVIKGEERSNKVDVYSFSIIILKILSKNINFPLKSIYETMKRVAKGERPCISNEVPKCYQELIESCWSEKSEDRPTFDQIVSVIKNNKEFITDIGANEEEFNKYINYIEGKEQQDLFEDFDKVNIDFEQYEKTEKKHFSLKMKKANLEKYEKKEEIGKGAFGKVFKVNKKGKSFAAKVSIKNVNECNDDEINSLTREIKIISQLSSPTIVKFIGYSPKDFDNQVKPTIITEILPNGSLDRILSDARKGLASDDWTETKKLINIYGIAYSMSYLHSLDIIHRDLKPENIFLDDYLYPKLGDFGLSKSLVEKLICESSVPQFYLKGTYSYMSPEILRSYIYSKASDVYAYSMIVYEILSNERPFDKFNQFQFLASISKGYRPEFNFPILNCYKELITKCWSNDPKERPTFKEIVRLLKTNKEFITDQVDENEFFDYIESIGDKIPSISKIKKIKRKKKKPTKVQLSSIKNTKIDEEIYVSTFQSNFLNLSNYEKVKLMYKSGIYKIYQMKNKETGDIYAGKFSSIEIDQLSRDEIINLSHEVNIMSGINHPSFLKFIGYSPYNYKNQQKPIILTEYPSNLTLSKILQLEREGHKIQSWDDTIKLINIYGIASGMKFLHSNQILHRDLNPESIFLDEHLFPKIGNFAFLTKNHTLQSMTYQSTAQIKGCPNYSAPEILTMNDYSNSSDVYSFALIVYEILTNKIPYENANNLIELINDIGKKGLRPSFNKSIPDCYRDLIESCWNQNPKNRPSFEEITQMLSKDERFITKNVNKESFLTYIKNIDSYKIEFSLKNKIADFNSIIENKGKIVEDNDNDDDDNDDDEQINLTKIQETE